MPAAADGGPESPLAVALAMLRALPGRGWAWVLGGGAAQAALELGWRWASGPGGGDSPALLLAHIPVGLAAIYGAAMAAVGARAALPGGVRFTAAAALLWAPMLAMIAVTAGWAQALGAEASAGEAWAVTTLLLVVLLASVLLSAWLAAWPVAQALSAALVDPIDVFAATSGHRWPLLVLSIVPAAVTAVDLPAPVDAPTLAQATLRCGPAAVLNAANLLFQAVAAAAAWSFLLGPDRPGGAAG